MKRAALYVRVSTQEQKKHGMSVDSQIVALQEYCENNGFTVVKIYNDAGLSARKPYMKRPALLQLLSDCEAGKIDVILVTRLDRWFRSVAGYHEVQTRLDKCHVDWKTIWEDYDTSTSDGMFKVNIMLSCAQAEADRDSERIKSVNKYRRSCGEYMGGLAPKGYKNIDKQLVIDQELEPYIKLFFRTYLDTLSPTKAIESIEDKIPLTRLVAMKMLKNPTYKGDAHGHKCPAYITESEYDLIMRSHEGRRIRERKKRVYIFSGLIKCPKCGRKLAGRCTTVNGHQYKMYRCNHGCGYGGNVYESKLEEYLLNELDKIISDYNAKSKSADIVSVKGDIDKLRKRLLRLGDRYELGDFTLDEYKAKRDEILKNIEDLESQMSIKEIPELPPSWKDIYQDLTEENKSIFFRKTVKAIDVIEKNQNGKNKEYRVIF